MSGCFRRQRLVVLASLVIVVAVPVTASRASGRGSVRVAVTPHLSTVDQPMRIAVHGLLSRQLVTVAVTSVDEQGIRWGSSATFRADHAGTVELDRTAPVAGSYAGRWQMGLIAMMKATMPAPAGAYFWSTTQALKFTVTVRSHGRDVASTTFQRRFIGRTLRHEHQPLSSHGFYGEYFAPSVSGRHPAILAIGGSQGGIGMFLVSEVLAAHGYPTLAIAYFNAPGLPPTLANIPLEYFAKALRWLRRQPGVDPNRIVVLGSSRGSEAAQLVGVHYPNLVHAVIAAVPSNVALCGYPDCGEPAWTLGAKPVPYTHEFNSPHPTDNPAAVIPVERIRGPILLNCGGKDTVWNSCAFAEAIVQRLDGHNYRSRHVFYRYPNAGHFVGALLPYEPAVDNDFATERARERFWPRLLAFLTAVARAPR